MTIKADSMGILPGQTIGILGGGQLARMGIMAARAMGYRVAILDPDPQCCAAALADVCVTAALDDVPAALALARQAAVVTYDIEKIGAAVCAAVAEQVPLRPGGHVVRMVQDRAVQKDWLSHNGFPVGPFCAVDDAAAVGAALTAWGKPGRLKTRQGGYDGRGQARVATAAAAGAAWAAIKGAPAVLEQEIDLQAELSVLVARRPSGAACVFPPAQNWHHDSILVSSVIPAMLPAAVLERACDISRSLAEALQLEGLLATEFFLTTADTLLINELAPRPHNTFHQADGACATSQFEQWVRAVCDLPLGTTNLVRPVALGNLLGDLWQGHPPDFAAALRIAGVQVRLYDKAPRPGRKMGHVLAAGETSEKAVEQVREALRVLGASI